MKQIAISFEIIFLNDSSQVYDLLKNGIVDAYIGEGPEEAVFDVYGDVVVSDFFPVIIQTVSLSTQNQELQPIISVVQKALHNGGKNYLNELYS